MAATKRQSLETSADLLRRAGALLTEEEYPVEHATVLLNLGDVAFYMGNPDLAMEHLARGRRLALGAGNRSLAAHIVINMGIIATDAGQYEAAGRALAEGALARDDLDTAEALFTEVLAIHRRDGLASRRGEALIGLSLVASERGDWRRSAALLLEALQLIEHTMNIPFLIEPDDQLLNLLVLSGDMTNAARILGFIHAGLARSDGGMSVFSERLFRRAEAAVHAALPRETLDALMEEGARIPEPGLNRELQRVVRQVIGRRQPDPQVPAWQMDEADRPDPFGLTDRELDVLRLVATRAIATILQVSERTVGTHVGNILAKMEVSSRMAAVALATRQGIIPLHGTMRR